MPFVIVVAQFKGGVGKTTVAVNLAGELTKIGWAVTLIDTDPQRCAMQWAAPHRLNFNVQYEELGARPVLWVRNVLKMQSDILVIDLPAGHSPVFDQAVLISDIIVVPCGASSLDVNSAQATIKRAKDALRTDPMLQLQFVLVPNRIDASTAEGTQIGEELRRLGGAVSPSLSHDTAYVRSFAGGLTAGDYDPQNTASGETRSLCDFIVRHSGLSSAVSVTSERSE